MGTPELALLKRIFSCVAIVFSKFLDNREKEYDATSKA